jgi:methylenetetrahydrofolate dehydrogenase (NADP+)/methenyltetrahydrofolate cyclohydrolase
VTERASIIDGAAVAEKIITRLSEDVTAFVRASGITPRLALVALGDDAVQRLYLRKKVVECAHAGIEPLECLLAEATTTAELRQRLLELNADPAVHGIFLQWPLPRLADYDTVVQSIAPSKDVDGMRGLTFVPAAALACQALIRTSVKEPAGLHAVLAGRPNVFAAQIARILRDANCTVTVAYRNHEDLAAVCRRADILIAALDEPEIVRGDWVKAGATVIDVGMNVIAGYDGRRRFVGDVRFDEVARVARAITPVPGGVGPVTIACLLQNTLAAAQQGRPRPK